MVAGAVALIVRVLAHASADNIIGYAYALAAAVGCFIFLHLLAAIPSRFSFWRGLTRKEQKFEGEWIETVSRDDKKYYSIFHLLYEWRNDRYVVSGVTLDHLGRDHSTWDSDGKLSFDFDKYVLSYIYSAREKGDGAAITGYVEVSFNRPARGKPTEGHGFMVDMKKPPVRLDYAVERIDRALKKRLIGSAPRVLKRERRAQFIVAYDGVTAQVVDG